MFILSDIHTASPTLIDSRFTEKGFSYILYFVHPFLKRLSLSRHFCFLNRWLVGCSVFSVNAVLVPDHIEQYEAVFEPKRTRLVMLVFPPVNGVLAPTIFHVAIAIFGYRIVLCRLVVPLSAILFERIVSIVLLLMSEEFTPVVKS